METTIKQILGGSNKVIAAKTKELNKSMEKPEKLLEALNVMASNESLEVRQFVAVMVKRHFRQGAVWMSLEEGHRARIKAGVLTALLNEPERSVRRSISTLVATLARYDLSKNNWPELEALIGHLYSKGQSEKELALMLLTHMAETSYHLFDTCFDRMLPIFEDALNSFNGDPSNKLPCKIVIIFNYLWFNKVPNKSLINTVDKNFGTLLKVMKLAAATDEFECLEMMEFLESIANSKITTKYFDHVYAALAEFTLDEKVHIPVRVKAVYLLGVLATNKKKYVIKKQLLTPILHIMFKFMGSCPEDEQNEEYFIDYEDEMTLTSAATQMLDMMAMHLPPNKLIPPLMEDVEAALKSDNVYQRKASYLALGILAEGCADTIKQSYLDTFVHWLCGGLAENTDVSRNAAFFALGQFSEFLTPEISNYANLVLPHLVNALNMITEYLRGSREDTKIMERMFYAIETFCDGLGDKDNANDGANQIQPYVQHIMEKLFEILNPHNTITTQTAALDVLGAVAGTAKDLMLPYLTQIVTLLRGYLSKQHNFDTSPLLSKALATLGVLWRKINKEHMRPLLQDTLDVAREMIRRSNGNADDDDPELRAAVYGLVGSVAISMGVEMEPHLHYFLECMLNSMNQTQGLEPVGETDDEDSAEDMEGVDDKSIASSGYEVENDYLEEKEQALMALKDIMRNTGPLFVPYLEKVFPVVYRLLYATRGSMKETCIETFTELVLYRLKQSPGLDAESQNGVRLVITALGEMVRQDDDISVVTAAVVCLKNLLKATLPPYAPLCDLKAYSLAPETRFIAEFASVLGELIFQVLSAKIVCLEENEQSGEEGGPGGDDLPEEEGELVAEAEEYLMECAGELLPLVGRVVPGEDFEKLFNMCYQQLLRKTTHEELGRRSFATGIIAECVSPLSNSPTAQGRLFPELYEVFMLYARDVQDVRCNSVFGLGELFYHAGEEFQKAKLVPVMGVLSELSSTETHEHTLDNLVGALARVIIVRSSDVPLDVVVPALLERLPLRKDFTELLPVYRCLSLLYQRGVPALSVLMSKLLAVTVDSLCRAHAPDEESKQLMCQLVTQIRKDFSQEFNNFLTTVPDEVRCSLELALAS